MVNYLTYDPFGDINGVTYGNGLNLRITRDLRSFPVEIKVDAPSALTPTMHLRYAADPVGNIVAAGIVVVGAAFVVIAVIPATENCIRNNELNCAQKCKNEGDNFSNCYDNCTRQITGKCICNVGTWASAFGGDPLGSTGGEIGGQIGKKLDE